MAEGQYSAGLHRRGCVGSIAPSGGLRPLACWKRAPGSLGTHGSKSVDCSIHGCDGVGVIGEVDRQGLPLVGKFPSCLLDRLMERPREDSGRCSVLIDSVASAKFGRAFVGPPGGGHAAKVSAVRTPAADRLSLGSNRIPSGLVAATMASGVDMGA